MKFYIFKSEANQPRSPTATRAIPAVRYLFLRHKRLYHLIGRRGLFVSVLGFFLFAIRAVMQAWVLDATPTNMGGTSIGILFGTQAIGAAIGPALGGILADHYGLMATFYFLAITIVIANLFIFLTPMSEMRQAEINTSPLARNS